MSLALFLLYLRNAAFYAVALAWCVPFVLLLPLMVLPFSVVWRVVVIYLKGVLFLLRWICGMRYAVGGAGPLPAGPLLFASAHQSSWESMFFHVILDNPAIIAKSKAFGYPVVGNFARRNRHIPTDRDGDPEKVRAAMLEAQRQVAQGRSVIIYPSGTRTGRMLDTPMQRGVAALYALLGVPCVPIALNSGLFWPNDSWLRYPGTVVVQMGEPIAPGLGKKVFLDLLASRMQCETRRLLSIRAGIALYEETAAGEPDPASGVS